MNLKKKVAIAFVGVCAIVLLAFGAYIGFYLLGHRALPRTYVGDTNVAGLTKAQIQQRLDLAVKNNRVEITGANVKPVKATLSDMGVKADTEKIAQQVFDATDQWWSFARAPFAATVVQPSVAIDNTRARDFSVSLTEGNKDAVAPVEPSVAMSNGTFTITEGKPGSGVDPEIFKAPAQKLLATLDNVKLTATLSDWDPSTQPDQYEQKRDAANKLLGTAVTVALGDKKASATADDKSKWIDVNNDSVSAEPQLIPDAITAWVQAKADEYSVDPVTGVRLVDKNGKELRVDKEAVAGVKVNNVKQVVVDIQKNMAQGSAVEAAFTKEDAQAQWEEKVIAAGAENLRYPAAEGEHWIDLDLTNNRLRAYSGADLVYDMDMLDGAPGMPTVTGQFKVYLKYPKQTMTLTGVTPNVPWVSYFTGNYAIHGAPWISQFGAGAPGGSHGCINLEPYHDAKLIYDFAPIGTVVVSHY